MRMNAEGWKCPKCGRMFSHTNQSHYCEKPKTIDEYIEQQNEQCRQKLVEMRAIIHNAIPEAEERISWSMPTYWKGRNLIHFAASKNHIGVYPGDQATEAFAEKLVGYDCSKGTIRFPYTEDLPTELITELAQWCYNKYRKS